MVNSSDGIELESAVPRRFSPGRLGDERPWADFGSLTGRRFHYAQRVSWFDDPRRNLKARARPNHGPIHHQNTVAISSNDPTETNRVRTAAGASHKTD